MFNPDPAELTTAATDLLLAIECVVVALILVPGPGDGARCLRVTVWIWILSLTAVGALLGTVVHGLDWSEPVQERLWMPLYFSLGLVVALFLVAATLDWRGESAARKLVPIAIVVAAVFFLMTRLTDRGFALFVAYEATFMLAALAIYIRIAGAGLLPGAGLIAIAIVLNMAAVGVQMTDVRIDAGVPLDHNGLFHLIQMIAIGVLAAGIRRGLASEQPG